MKKIKICLFCFISITCFSQKSAKPQYIFDENNQLITSDQYKNKIEDKNIELFVYEVDTAFIARFNKIIDIGILSSSEMSRIKNELQKISKKEIDSSKTIIINFFYKDNPEPNDKSCIDNYFNDEKYKKYLNKNKDIIQFFITEKDYNYKDKNVLQDSNDVIRSILFKYYSFCGNYIIIKPNGSFFRKIGEYRQDEIPKNVKSF